MDNLRDDEMNEVHMFGSDDELAFTQVPTQAQSVVEGSGSLLVSEYKPVTDVDYLQVHPFIGIILWGSCSAEILFPRT